MSQPTDPRSHRPDPEFVDRLEWQLRGELRRCDRFAAPARSRGIAKVAVVAIICLALGFASATAAQDFESRGRVRYLRIQAAGWLELAELREDYMREMLAEMTEAGQPAETLAAVETELEHVRLEIERSRLNLEEIESARTAPTDEITAPLVGGRDFVTERLMLQLRGLELNQDLMRRRASVQGTPGPSDPGLSPLDHPEARAAFLAESEQLEVEMGRLRADLDLRRQFLSDESSAREVLRRQQRERAEASVRAADARLQQIESQWDRVRRAIDAGQASRWQLRELEFEFAQARLDARLARAELQTSEAGDR